MMISEIVQFTAYLLGYQEFGFKAKTDFREGLEKTVELYSKNLLR